MQKPVDQVPLPRLHDEQDDRGWSSVADETDVYVFGRHQLRRVRHRQERVDLALRL